MAVFAPRRGVVTEAGGKQKGDSPWASAVAPHVIVRAYTGRLVLKMGVQGMLVFGNQADLERARTEDQRTSWSSRRSSATGHGVSHARQSTGFSGTDREGRRARTENASMREGPGTYETDGISCVRNLLVGGIRLVYIRRSGGILLVQYVYVFHFLFFQIIFVFVRVQVLLSYCTTYHT